MNGAEDVLIIGAGGFGLEVLQYARDSNAQGWPYRVSGFIDDTLGVGTDVDQGVVVMGTSDDTELMGGRVIIAVGEPAARAELAKKVLAIGGRFVTLVHPAAYVAPTAQVGEGSVICPFALVGARSAVGRNGVVNVYASVGHESMLGSHCVLSPYSALLGRSSLGARSFLGVHASLGPGVRIGPDSKVSAGSFARNDAEAGSLVVGNPGKSRVVFARRSASK